MLQYFKLLLKAFSQLFIIFDPWLFTAFLSVVIWIVAKFFPNVVLKIIRSGCVFVYWVVTLISWRRCVFKIVLLLEYNFHIEENLLLFFRNESDECIHCILTGIIFCIWFGIGIILFIYELTHWKVVKANTKNDKYN